jgi:hypothetical protein
MFVGRPKCNPKESEKQMQGIFPLLPSIIHLRNWDIKGKALSFLDHEQMLIPIHDAIGLVWVT